MPLLYDIPLEFISQVQSGEAKVVGALIKEIGSGKILAHVQPTNAFYNALGNAGSSIPPLNFSPLGVIQAVQNEQIKSTLASMGEQLNLVQGMQFANLALTGIGIGVSVAGFAVVNARLTSIETHLGSLREEVSEIGKMIQAAELRRLFSDIRATLKDLSGVATRTDHLSLASNLQSQLSTHVSTLSGLLVEAMTPGQEVSLPMERLDLIWTLSAAKWQCEEAELFALFVSEDLDHADQYASRYISDNLSCLERLNPDALARLVAAAEEDLEASTAKRRAASHNLGHIGDGFAASIDGLQQKQSLAQALRAAGISGRAFVRAAAEETEKPLLVLVPEA